MRKQQGMCSFVIPSYLHYPGSMKQPMDLLQESLLSIIGGFAKASGH